MKDYGVGYKIVIDIEKEDESFRDTEKTDRATSTVLITEEGALNNSTFSYDYSDS